MNVNTPFNAGIVVQGQPTVLSRATRTCRDLYSKVREDADAVVPWVGGRAHAQQRGGQLHVPSKSAISNGNDPGGEEGWELQASTCSSL